MPRKKKSIYDMTALECVVEARKIVAKPPLTVETSAQLAKLLEYAEHLVKVLTPTYHPTQRPMYEPEGGSDQ
jgi:ABC-type cobalt transport system substrate-binding protein